MNKSSLSSNNRLFNRYFILVWLVGLTLNLGQSMMNSTVTLYMNHLGYPESLSGLVGLPYAIFAILARILAGGLCDKRGRRIVLVLSCVLFSVSVFLFGLSTGVFALMLFRGLHGAGFSVAQTASNTVLVDVTPDSRRSTGIGVFFVSTAAAFAIGSPIVLGLSSKGNYSPVFIFCTSMLALGAIFSLCSNYEKKPNFQPKKEEVVDDSRGFRRYFEPKALPAGLVLFFMSFGGLSISAFALLYATKMGFAGASLFFTITAVVMFVFNLSQAWLVKKLGANVLLFLTFLIFGATVILQALTGSNVCYFIMGFGFGVLQGVCWPVATALAVEGIPYNRRGAANSTSCLMTDIGAGGGSVVFGAMITKLDYPLSFTLLGVFLLVGAVLCLFMFRKKRV